MPGKGREHFESYHPATRAKHAILAKYLHSYLRVLRAHARAFHYIDGFAGPGYYDANQPGSPVIAVRELLAQPSPASVTLVDNDRRNILSLKASMQSIDGWERLYHPHIACAEFANTLDDALSHPIYRQYSPVATFSFVDPCGVSGVRIQDIARLLKPRYAECLLLWNYDGVNRWLGAYLAGSLGGEGLRSFFGGAEALKEAESIFKGDQESATKEQRLRSLFTTSLRRACGAEFNLPFRFEARDAERTSHYLIHCTKNALGFKIMKEIMTSSGGDVHELGGFDFLPPDDQPGQSELFRPLTDELARTAILAELDKGPKPVKLFTELWVLRPSDYLVAKRYRSILIDMESEGLIEVVDPSNRQVKPRAGRVRKGQVTLADRMTIRRRK